MLGGVLLFGVYSGARQNFVYRAFAGIKDRVDGALTLVMEEAPTLTGSRPDWFLQYPYYPGDGVTVGLAHDNGKIMLAGFFEGGNQIRLIERDGTVIARWPVVFSDLFPDSSYMHEPPATDWNIDMHGTLMHPDGSVVFTFEHGGLVKLDRCGKVEWKIARETHHSVEVAESGGYWVPGSHFITDESAREYPPFQKPYYEDTILRVSADGEILGEKSVVEIFYENGLVPLLTATGQDSFGGTGFDQEILHLNKVGELGRELAADFPDFAAGDLILSVRELNLVMVVDPVEYRVKWWKVGPWVRQHDPEFEAGGKISVFNNNVYRTAFGSNNPFRRAPLTAPRVSNIIVIDPATNEYEIAYGGKEGQEMLSVVRGKQQSTEQGGWLITEHTSGRVFEVDANGDLVWEFVNRYDEDAVAEITEARLYADDYFTVSDWACPF